MANVLQLVEARNIKEGFVHEVIVDAKGMYTFFINIMKKMSILSFTLPSLNVAHFFNIRGNAEFESFYC